MENLNELIPIKENNGKKAVNARDLHAFLESKQQFADWIKNRIKQYDFEEGVDYETIEYDYQGNVLHKNMKYDNQKVSKRDYALSVDSSKELSMVEGNDKGKQARRYFIACENAATGGKELSRKELALMVIQQEEEKERLQLENKVLNRQIEDEKPSVVFTDAVKGAKTSCLIGELAKIIAQNGYPIGEKRLFEWMRDRGYLGKCGERYNVPNQQYIEQGLFEIKKGVRSGSGGVLHTTITSKVTGKGQVYFVNKFLSK